MSEGWIENRLDTRIGGPAGIAEVVHSMQEYCINREDLDFLVDVTKFKTKGDWNEDPMKDIPPGVKSSFTRFALLVSQGMLHRP